VALFDGGIYVADINRASIGVFPAQSAGPVDPIRLITGSHTNLGQPVGLALFQR
jgi:hypothetical protein